MSCQCWIISDYLATTLASKTCSLEVFSMIFAFSRNLCSFDGVVTAFTSCSLSVQRTRLVTGWRGVAEMRESCRDFCVERRGMLLSGLHTLWTLITPLCSPSKERHHPAPGQSWQHRSTDQTVCLETVRETTKKTDDLERRVSQTYCSSSFISTIVFWD